MKLLKYTLFLVMMLALTFAFVACAPAAAPEVTDEEPAAEEAAPEGEEAAPEAEEAAPEGEEAAPEGEEAAPEGEDMAEGEEAAPEGEDMAEGEMGTIVDIAVADENFSTLVEALTAAELVETLQGEGPFTVFAPTNEAFEALPEGTLEGLLEDTEALSTVLLYHVVEGSVMAADVVELESAPTVQGEDITITVDGETVMVNGATVTAVDIEGSNGVIHVIDAVILPPSMSEN